MERSKIQSHGNKKHWGAIKEWFGDTFKLGQLCSGDSGGHSPIDPQSPCLPFSWVARIFGKGRPDFIHHSEREIKLRGKSGAQVFALSAQSKREMQKRRSMAF
jgi:hypothetical protein